MATNAPATPASAACAASSAVLTRLPLWHSARPVPASVVAERRLRVLPGGGAGRGVAGVPDREVPAQAAQRRLVEDLADQPEVLVDDDARRRRTPRSRPPPDRGAGGRTDRSRSASRPPPPAPRHRRRHRRPEVRDSGDRGRASAVHHREAPAETTGADDGPGCRWGEGGHCSIVIGGAVRRSWAMLEVAGEEKPHAQRPTRPQRLPRAGPADAARAVRRHARRRRGAVGGGDALRARVPRARAPEEQRENLTFALARAPSRRSRTSP